MALALDDTGVTGTTGTTEVTAVDRPVAARPTGTGTSRPGRRLGRRLHKALLATHVLTAVGWFGAAVMVALCGVVGSADGEIALYELIRTSLWLTVPLGLGAAVTGVLLSLTTKWGLARYWWVVLKELGTVAVIATDVLVVGPEMAEAVDTSTATALPGPVFAHCVVLALATILSIAKPRARTPLAR
jgi:hypothetical protein